MLLPFLSSLALGVCFISVASELGLWLPLWATLIHGMKWLSIKKKRERRQNWQSREGLEGEEWLRD